MSGEMNFGSHKTPVEARISEKGHFLAALCSASRHLASPATRLLYSRSRIPGGNPRTPPESRAWPDAASQNAHHTRKIQVGRGAFAPRFRYLKCDLCTLVLSSVQIRIRFKRGDRTEVRDSCDHGWDAGGILPSKSLQVSTGRPQGVRGRLWGVRGRVPPSFGENGARWCRNGGRGRPGGALFA